MFGIRDIICFIPLIIFLPLKFGIEGILFAAPCADLIAMIVAAALTVRYFRKLDKESASAVTQHDLEQVAL